MSPLRGGTLLPGRKVWRLKPYVTTYSCNVERAFQASATIPKTGRRRLAVFAGKFTVNTNQTLNRQQVVVPTTPVPTTQPRQPAAAGVFPALAGGLIALVGIATMIWSALRKVSANDAGAQGAFNVDRVAQPAAIADAWADSAAEGLTDLGKSRSGGGLEAALQHGQLADEDLTPGDAGSGLLQHQQRDLELEQAHDLKAASELREELRNREQELLEAQREGSVQVAGARGELKESRRKAELLEAMVSALRERLKREENRNSALEEEIQSGRAEMARFAAERQVLHERIESLRVELADTQARLTSAQARSADLDARVAQLVAQNSELERRVAELEAHLQAMAVSVGSAAGAAEDKLRLMHIEADEERLLIAKLQGQLADREAQLAVLHEGQSELQQVLEQSKVAAAQISELLRQRDEQLQLMREALRGAEERRLEQEEAVKEQVAALKQARESELQRLEEAVKEAEARRLNEASVMRSKLEDLQRRHEAELQRLHERGRAATQTEVITLKEEMSVLQSERDREVALLNSQLQDSARHAEELQEAAKAQAATQQAEVETLRKQLESAMIHAEQSSARRVAEVSALRSSLEQQLGAARQEALDAGTQLAVVREQLDGMLSEEFLGIMEEELRQAILPRSSAAPAPAAKAIASGSPAIVQELRALESREAVLRRQLESLSSELSQLQSGAVARLGPAMVTKAQELEATAAQCRKALRAREAVGDELGVQRVTQQLAALSLELAALYRSVMVPGARTRETAVMQELQDCETELQAVVEQQIRLQDQLELEQRDAEQRKEKAVAAASGPSQQQLRKAVQSRVEELLKEREQQVQQQAAAREQQLLTQLRAAQAGSETHQRELKTVQGAVEKQARLMEESWRLQLEASSRALKEAAMDKQRLAAEVGRSTEQVQQKLDELESLRRELVAARSTVAALRRAAESSRASAAEQSVGAAQEVQRLTAQVQRLHVALQERERQYAASNGAPTSASSHQASTTVTAATAPGFRDRHIATPPASQIGDVPACVTPASGTLARRNAASIATSTGGPTTAMPVDAIPFAVNKDDVGVSGAVVSGSTGAAQDLQTLAGGNEGFRPLTPLRPGWPAQFDRLVPLQPAASQKPTSAVPTSATAAAGTARQRVTALPASTTTSPRNAPVEAGTAATVGNASKTRTHETEASGSPGGNSVPHAQAYDTAAGPSPPVRAEGSAEGRVLLNSDANATGPTGPGNGNGNMPSGTPTASASQGSVAELAAPATTSSPTDDSAQSASIVPPALVTLPPTSSAAKQVQIRKNPSEGDGRSDEVSSSDFDSSGASASSPKEQSTTATEHQSVAPNSNTFLNSVTSNDEKVVSQPPLRPLLQPRQRQRQGTLGEALRRSVPPGPFESIPPSAAAAEPRIRAAPPTTSTVSDDAQSPSRPPTNEHSAGSSATAAAAVASKKASSSDGTSSRVQASASTLAAAVSPSSAALPPTLKPSSNEAPASAPAASSPSPSTLPAALSGAFIKPAMRQPGSPSPPPTGGASGPPPIKPLMPLKMATPADSPRFVQATPDAPATSSSGNSSARRATYRSNPPGSPTSPSPPTTAGAKSIVRQTSSQGASKPQLPQSPAAAAMTAAAGAAEAARRAAAAVAEITSPAKVTGFDAPPIAEWGRSKPSPEAPNAASTAPSNSSGGKSSEVRKPLGGNKTPEGRSGTPSSSDAELGAEIAAIAQSLVQRTVGGAARPTTPLTSSPLQPQSKTPLTAASHPPQGASVAVAAPGPTAGSWVGSVSGVTAPSGPLSSVSRRLQLSVAAYGVPHVAKADKGSEDAFFLLTPSSGVVTSDGAADVRVRPAPGTEGPSALGVADGVGGWAEANVDAGQYSREIMTVAARVAAEGGQGATDPRRLLAVAQASVRTIGSCTACVAVLSNGGDKGPRSTDSGQGPGGDQVLSIANLGDSGCRVVRRGSLLLATSAQEHQFNMPYQMAHPDNLPYTDTAEDAQMYQLALEPGDVVVLGTDGLFDNMWDEELVAMVAAAASNVPPGLAGPAAGAAAQNSVQQLATSLVSAAFRHAQDPAFRSPWAVEFANQPSASWLSRMFPRGGKMDDITAVVAIVTAA